MTACEICTAEVTAKDPLGYPYCRGCHYSGAAYAALYAPLLASLAEVGVRATFIHTGGGCWVLEVPVEEHGKRVAWFGWHDGADRDDWDFLVHCPPYMLRPTVESLIAAGTWVAAGVYLLNDDGDMDRQAWIDARQVDRHGPATLIRAIATEAMQLPDSAFQLV